MKTAAGMMNLMRIPEPNVLVDLVGGRYPLVDSEGVQFLEVPDGKRALLLEKVGSSPKNRQCWHALVEGAVILVWDDHFGAANPC